MLQANPYSDSPVKVSSIIGTNVFDPLGDDLGEISDIVIDFASGKVIYAVVSYGGFLSMGRKLFAVPFEALRYHNEQARYVLDVLKDQFATATGFDDDDWPVLGDEKWNRDIYAHYNRRPHWE
ncbi:MAG: PRC-barrel domain-containing protein [Burkholderiales bacterium]